MVSPVMLDGVHCKEELVHGEAAAVQLATNANPANFMVEMMP